MDGVPGWRVVGQGSGGTVYAVHAVDTAERAVKWTPIDETNTQEEAIDEFVMAARLARVQAPSFIRVYAAFRARLHRGEDALAVVMELAEEPLNLRDLVTLGGVELRTDEAAAILLELLWSMFIAHTQVGMLYHGDLHGANVVFRQRPPGTPPARFVLYGQDSARVVGAWTHAWRARPYIVDFGHASFLRPGQPMAEGPSGQGYESLAMHRPPELYFGRDRRERGPASDVWQLGVLALTLFARRPQGVQQTRQQWMADLIDLPLAFASGARDLVGAFLQLLSEQRLSVAVRAQVDDERHNGNMYGRFLNIVLMQEALGNGWFPDPGDTPLFKGHCFFEAMRSFEVTSFMHAHLLGPASEPMRLARELVQSLPGRARDLMRRMLAWNPAKRPTCMECLCDPWFRDLFGNQQQHGDLGGETYTAHARRPLHRNMFSAAAKLGLSGVAKRRLEVHEHFLAAEQERLRRSVLKSPVITSQAGVVEMVAQSFLS
jgi:serine/threonine protein kinase